MYREKCHQASCSRLVIKTVGQSVAESWRDVRGGADNVSTKKKRGAKYLLSLGREERHRGADDQALKNYSNTLS